jgi:pimeloyl-ACP methyl ester carboxylesterase
MESSDINLKCYRAEEYLTLLSHPQLQIIENVGHSLAFEQPRRYQALIQAFLKKSNSQY